MLDNENNVFQSIAATLRAEFTGVFVAGEEITGAPPRFPAVTVIQNNNEVNTRYSTFDDLENVVIEEYKIETYSNLQADYSRVAQAKALAKNVCATMDSLGYIRTFCQPIKNADETVSRMVLRFRKSNITAMEVI